MADASASALVRALLEDSAAGRKLLADSLAGDPPLAVWTACQAGESHAEPPGSIAQLAEWLAAGALDWWQGDSTAPDFSQTDDTPQAAEFARLVERDLQVAALAALAGSATGQAAAEEAHVLGLLGGASDWLTLVSGGAAERTVRKLLPPWLQEKERSRSLPYVEQAARAVAEGTCPDGAGEDWQHAQQRAGQLARRWREVGVGCADLLPAVARRLGRLAALEEKFQCSLEHEKLEALAEFAAGAGHEINNPLAIIGGRAQLLLKDEKDPQRRRELALINAQVRRAHEMIADMRLFSRPPRPQPESLDLVELVDRVIDELADRAAEQAIRVGRTGDHGPLTIKADRAGVSVVVQALCRNALEAIGHDGAIEIDVRREGESVRLTVRDDGPGISPQQRSHIFDPFYSARQAGRGLGFGLSKVWRIVTCHGGRIEVQSRPGEGAALIVWLPRKYQPDRG